VAAVVTAPVATAPATHRRQTALRLVVEIGVSTMIVVVRAAAATVLVDQ
jgi:hypothetical protein